MTIEKIIIGTRGSKLALIQAEEVISELKKVSNKYSYELRIIKTHGDKFNKTPVHKLGRKGVFVKEIDKALLEGVIDISVHSMKDLPSTIPEGIFLGAIPKRKTYKDAIYSRENKNLTDLKSGSIIGTGSFRRRSQVLYLRKDVNINNIRGNIDTRIKKVDKGEFDAIILAKVGVQRLNLKINVFELPEFILPAAGQGALAVETRANNHNLIKLLSKINDQKASLETLAEMAFINNMGGGCQIPIGVLGQIIEKSLHLKGEILSLDGNQRISASITGKPYEYKKMAEKLANKIQKNGGFKILNKIDEQLKRREISIE
ncbi:MAG: hydroxymethylbilane synthase [Candidatus Helarchaeota archaeon]|nr:hydroxymethylbilane synthase [Candidatus Helarchaeota archaeon]